MCAIFLWWTGWVILPYTKNEKIPRGHRTEKRKEADGNSADGHRTDADRAIFGSITRVFYRVLNFTSVFYGVILRDDFTEKNFDGQLEQQSFCIEFCYGQFDGAVDDDDNTRQTFGIEDFGEQCSDRLDDDRRMTQATTQRQKGRIGEASNPGPDEKVVKKLVVQRINITQMEKMGTMSRRAKPT